MLNPDGFDYRDRLERLLVQMGKKDPLRDNVLLAEAKLVADEQLRAEKLAELHKQYQATDGGMGALYELGLLRIGMWQDESNLEKKEYLGTAKATLMSCIDLYPEGFCAEQVRKILNELLAN